MVSGLKICQLLTADEESLYMKKLYEYTWSTKIKRRVLNFGYSYDYKGYGKNDIYNMEKWLIELFNKCKYTLNMKIDCDISKLMVIVNEYEPGQGISSHIDNTSKFGEWIICVVLNSGSNIIFTDKNERHSYYIKNRDVYVMSGESRYKYKHEITKTKSDKVGKNKIKRDIRVSITFRLKI